MSLLTKISPGADAKAGTPPAQVDPHQRVHILIEAAMKQSQFSDSDSELVVRQLAGELNKMSAALSDVRTAVVQLYHGDRAAAEAYLGYLAESGFPQKTPSQPSETHQQVARVRSSLAEQNKSVSQYDLAAYGQIAPEQADEVLCQIAFYSGNLIAELVMNSAYSSLLLGERRSGTSALLRAIIYDQISKSGNTIFDALDLLNGEWGGLENIRLEDGSQIVNYRTISGIEDIEAVAQKFLAVAAEVKRREHQQRTQTLALSDSSSLVPYLFLIDGLSEIHAALPGWTADRRSKEPSFSKAANALRFILSHGPGVGVSCVATARDHGNCLCDTTALGETKLLFLGRISAGHNGGYRAIDRAIEDTRLLPSPHDRSQYRDALSVVKKIAYPTVFTPNGIPRLGRLGNFSGYLSVHLLTHYQFALESRA